jgi:catechol 2,3-dioxygenase-like lactoylglutathione lyase family enzyme
MIVHICMGTNDLERSARFYDAITAELGFGRRNATDKAIYWANPGSGIGFAITKPFDGQPATFGNGTMATIASQDEAQVDRVHAAALANGGSCEGPPGVRANGIYTAYFRDPDGNKLNTFALPRK